MFVISDFISAPGWERPLDLLNRRHDVLAVRLIDPREVELPDVGPLIMEDAETGEQLYVDTHDRGFRRRFQEAAAAGARPRWATRSGAPASTRWPCRPTRTSSGRSSGWRPCAGTAPEVGDVVHLAADARCSSCSSRSGCSATGRSSERRRRRAAVHGGLGLTRPAGPAAGRPGVSRIPAVLFLVGLTIMVVALARPQSAVDLPREEGTVILAFDVSGSMAADDLKPTRMDAAKAATRRSSSASRRAW